MQLALSAIVPIIVVLGLGSVLRHHFLVDDAPWRGFEWLSYRIFTPALFVCSIARTSLTEISLGPLVTSLGIPVLTVSVLLANAVYPHSTSDLGCGRRQR